MNINEIRLIKGDALVEIPSLISNTVAFNGGELEIVTKVKVDTSHGDNEYMLDLARRIRKYPKDEALRREYTKASGRSFQETTGDPVDHEAKQARRYGKLVKLPEKSDNFSGWDFKCELDAEPGDMVYWDSFYTKEQQEGTADVKMLKEDGKVYLMIPARSIFCAKRGEEFIGCNGHIIGKPLEKKREDGLVVIGQESHQRIEVLSAPKSLPEYADPSIWANTTVKKGDVIVIPSHFAIRLDSTAGSNTELVRVAIRTILAVE